MAKALFSKLITIVLIVLFGFIPIVVLMVKPEDVFTYEPLNPPFEEDNDGGVDIIFAGDIMLARRIEQKIQETNVNYPFESTHEYLQTADLRVGNLECVLSSRGELIEGREMPFRADPELVEGLAYADFHLLTLANNHILDYGAVALNDTIENLDDGNIKYTGLYTGESINDSKDFMARPLLFQRGAIQFAFLSYAQNPPAAWAFLDSFYEPIPLENDTMIAEIDYVKKQYPSAVIIIQIHWRISPQYQHTHTTYQEEITKSAIDAGATVVACHGPHAIQDIEAYQSQDNKTKGLILYSLGNYVFDLSNETSHYSILAKIGFEGTTISRIGILPIYRQDLQYSPAGKEKIYEYDPVWSLEWEQCEKLFTFKVNNPFFGPNLGSYLGIILSVPFIGISFLLKRRKLNREG